jgi:hypothetical protein
VCCGLVHNRALIGSKSQDTMFSYIIILPIELHNGIDYALCEQVMLLHTWAIPQLGSIWQGTEMVTYLQHHLLCRFCLTQ